MSQQLHIPSSDQLSRLPKEVSTAASEVTSLREKHLAARHDLVELEHARDRARAADTEAAAAALRSGQKAPAAKLPKAETAIEKALPQVDALALAAKHAEADLDQAIENSAEETAKSLRAEAVEQRAAARALAEQLVTALDDIESSQRLAAWLEEPSRWIGRFRMGDLAIKQPNGAPVDVQAAAAQLEAALAPPPPPKPHQGHVVGGPWPAQGLAVGS
jgi:hypothetical protein